MRVRKKRVRKFYIPVDGAGMEEFYFELRTVPENERDKVISDAYVQKYKRPASKSANSKADVEIETKIKYDLIASAEREMFVVSFILPGEDGEVIRSDDPKVDKAGTLNMLDEELGYYLAQCIDIMQGNRIDADVFERLSKTGVTLEMMGLTEADLEDVGDPTTAGDSA